MLRDDIKEVLLTEEQIKEIVTNLGKKIMYD